MKTTAAGIRERVLGEYDRFWTHTDFGGSPDAVEKALSRLTKDGHLRRVRPGLYWRGRETPLGMAPPDPTTVAKEIVRGKLGDVGFGPAATTAALSLGLTSQIPRVHEFAINARPPRDIRGIRFVGRTAPGREEEELNPREIALLEVLRDWSRVVDKSSNEAISTIAKLVHNGQVRPSRLARASKTEPARVRERLRTLFTRIGATLEADRIPPARGRYEFDLSLAS